MLENPLTPPDRRRVVSLVEASDPGLAERLERELADDGGPLVRVLTHALEQSQAAVTGRLDDLIEDQRTTRRWVIGLVALAMVLQTVLVGGAVSFSGGGFSLSTSASAATPTSAELELVDEDLGAAGPSPDPVDPQL